MSKYVVVYANKIAQGIGDKVYKNFSLSVIQTVYPDLSKMTYSERKNWIKKNNKRMKSICKFLNENNL